MYKYKSIPIIKFFHFLFIIFICFKKCIALYNEKEMDDNNNNKNNNTVCTYKRNFLALSSINTNDCFQLNVGYNKIEYNESKVNYNCYHLNLNNILGKEKRDKKILLYTNFTDQLYEINTIQNMTKFDLFDLSENEGLSFMVNKKKKFFIGFIDFLLVNKGEYEIIKNVTREYFYNEVIHNLNLLNNNEGKKNFIVYVPNDNESESYFLQVKYSEDSYRGSENIKLYYINSFKYDKIDKLMKDFPNRRMKRDRKIYGKIEIFGYEYKNLKENITLTLDYIRMKGEGITGFIITLSLLFIIFITIVVIFIKNAYFT